ncbi:MAG: N-acetyl-gamma-glutamyl-phosphate reductase [Xanthomonadales bacterium]|nr:N-acetyl-gamma-glutamyl-phosphate reductase [Xanthomonadales bacterium]
MSARIALIGGRGYTGAEFLKYLARHPQLELAFASSASNAGRPLRESFPDWPDAETRFANVTPEDVAKHEADAWLLAVPNGAAAVWAAAIRKSHPNTVILDFSADHRFDDGWCYGLPERNREQVRAARNIANPGCYATGAQLALLPLVDRLQSAPVVFGVSGYSGAGKTPSARNDPERLRDNLIPYTLNGHVHEREISHQLSTDVRFMPHVAPFFRGISLTLSARLDHASDAAELLEAFSNFYAAEPRVRVSAEVPEIPAVRGGPDAHIGGFSVDVRHPRTLAWVAVLDNLGKGAASQAMQNLNLALQFDEHLGLDS